MKTILIALIVACSAPAVPVPVGEVPACPDTPASLAPADDADLAFALDVTEGSQRYSCTASGFSAAIPSAQLFSIGTAPHQVITHFGGPSWEANDSSAVVAAKTAGATVDPASIQWVLLNVVSHFGPDQVTAGGVAGDVAGPGLVPSLLSPITQIQRLQTHGGLAPATGCDAAHVGLEFDSPYGARYFFYRSAPDVSPDRRVRCGARLPAIAQ